METSKIKKGSVLAIFDPLKYTHYSTDIGHIAGTRVTIWTKYHDPKEIRNFHTVILSPLASRIITNDESIIEKEIIRILEEGAHVCILCDSESNQDKVFADILLMVSGNMVGISRFSEINTIRAEFRKFLRDYGIVSNVFVLNEKLESVICTMKYGLADPTLQNQITKFKNEAVVGFTIKKLNGLITFLPFRFKPSFNTQELPNAVLELAESLDTHRKNLIFEPPSWINLVTLEVEEKARKRMSEMNNELRSKQIIIDQQQKLKSILWLKHDELVDGSMAVLKAMGISTSKNDIGEEDFWIINEKKSNIIICECKGKDNNLKREDINMLDIHRDARGMKESFPALLIVNSFNKANSLSEKDMPIPSNVIELAVKLNVLVIRSLDLVHLLDLFQNRSMSSNKILSYFSKSNGWMKVTEKVEVFAK